MSDEFDELKEAYKVEAAELLADFESVLIDLEDNPNSSDVLEQVLNKRTSKRLSERVSKLLIERLSTVLCI